MSDELNLNEIECVRLLVDANREVYFAESNFFHTLLSTMIGLLSDHLTCIHGGDFAVGFIWSRTVGNV